MVVSLFLFQLERDVAAGLLAEPWSGWGPHCYDSSQRVASGKILGLYAWDFSQEDEATLTHLCKSLIWKLHWKVRLQSLLSLQIFALKQVKNSHTQRLFFLVREVSQCLLRLDFKGRDRSSCFGLNCGSVVWSQSWLAGVSVGGKRGMCSPFPFGIISLWLTWLRRNASADSCSDALSYFRDFCNRQNINHFL